MDWTLQLKATMYGLTDAGEFCDVPPSRSVCMTAQSSPATPRTLLPLCTR